MELVIAVLLNGLFILIPFLITRKNARYLLSGYNTLTEEKRRNFDLDGYLVVFRSFFITLGLVGLVIIAALWFAGLGEYSIIASIFVPLLAFPYLIVKGREFYHDEGSSRVGVYVAIAFLVIVGTGIGMLLAVGLKQNEILIDAERVEIKGMYGTTIPTKKVISISLVEDLPGLSLRTDGFAMANHYKGRFRTIQGDEVVLYVNANFSPYLELRTEQQTYYWNAHPDDTKAMYRKLEEELRKSRDASDADQVAKGKR